MELGLSTLLFPNASPEDGAQLASQLDLDYVEVIMDMPHFSLDPERERLKKLGKAIKSWGLKVRVHGRFWDLNPTSQYPEIRETSLKRAIESIKACNLLGGDVATIHPGRCWFRMNQEMLEQCMKRYQDYIQKAEEVASDLGVILAIETGAHHADLPQRIDEYDQILESFKNLGITLDIGHSFITACRNGEENPEKKIVESIREFDDRLVNVHLHDNNGWSDEHLPPGRGKIKFSPILGALKESYGGPIILELWNPAQPQETAEEGVRWIKATLSSH